ncbi:hypothetical protein KFL_000480025 [Klebsormidium nitens]|uniref:Uncharacterized protein n=1 Tax=Klebsormidium nitens TaxID=105231 RepID=A0A1Y1HT31_KLENI|nr:hypothetical protein KFL_000480025 [Klebsormidium nitens]|eukprot:GAQ80161.1 hypothetical protein KFL_000480025 [Klebsormidium nitens]
MTGIKGSFSTFKMLEPGTRAIKFENKGFLEVAGVGTVELRCETPTGECLDHLRSGVVLAVAKNLFPVKKATAIRAEVVFRSEVCEMCMDGEVMLWAEKNAENASIVFARLELQSGKKVKAVQTDSGGEYINEGMTTLLGKKRDGATNHGGALSQTKRIGGSVEPDAGGESTGFATGRRVGARLEGESDVDGQPHPEPGTLERTRQDPVEKVLRKKAERATRMGEADTRSEDSDEGDGGQEKTAQRYPARERRAPVEWYRANLAAKTGSIPRGCGSIRSRKRIKKP